MDELRPGPAVYASVKQRAKRHGRVCMHVHTTARKDPRVLREAQTVASALNATVTIVDIEYVPSGLHTEIVDRILIHHVNIPRLLGHFPVKPYVLTRLYRMLGGALALLRIDADLYHAHDITALPACYIAARLRRKPLIFDAHELPLVDPHIVRRRLVHTLGVRLLRRMTRRCAGIITVSSPIARELQHRYGGPEPVLVRNIPPYQVTSANNLLRQRLGLDASVRIALYHGGLQDNRNLVALVECARFLDPGHVLVLMGDGEMQTLLKQRIAKAELRGRVYLLPSMPYSDLLSWVASADLGLILYDPAWSPNVRYCLPNKLFEFAMAGVPVLSSPLDAVVEVIGKYGCGQAVNSIQPKDLGRAISQLLADSASRSRMHKNALEASRTALCWEVEAHQLVNLYARILVPGNVI